MVPIPVAAVLEPAPQSASVAELPACAAGDLTLSFDGENGAFDGMQHGGTLMVVRNVGSRPCRLGALPRIAFAGPGGAALPIRFGAPPGLHPGPAAPPVGIAPGAEVTAQLRWVSSDVYPGGRCYGTASITVTFDSEALRAPFAAHLCGAATGATYSQSWLKADAPLQVPQAR